MANVILFNKPYGVHSQFRKDNEQMQTLADFFTDKSFRVAGRLDKDSEGLLILTDDGAVNHVITTPPNKGNAKKQGKTYLVQVENIPTQTQIDELSKGVLLKDGKTLPSRVRLLTDDELPIYLWERNPPIRERKSIPTAWLAMTIFEGKNRQVRRMVAHVGLPCLRLIRYQVGDWTLCWQGMQLGVGEHCTITLTSQDLLALGVQAGKTEIKNHHHKPKQTDKKSKTSSSDRHAKSAYATKNKSSTDKRLGGPLYRKSNSTK